MFFRPSLKTVTDAIVVEDFVELVVIICDASSIPFLAAGKFMVIKGRIELVETLRCRKKCFHDN